MERRMEICEIKLYDNGIYAGRCILGKGHDGNHKLYSTTCICLEHQTDKLLGIVNKNCPIHGEQK